jgi:methyl-accepting chemotaxis protein
MKLRFTIANRLALGFGILTMALLANSFVTYNILTRSIEKNNVIQNIYNPSANYLNQLTEMLNNSKMLVKNWVYIDTQSDTPDKLKLKALHEVDFPELHGQILSISQSWSVEEQEEYQTAYAEITDKLFPMHKEIMEQLSDFESYDDPMILFMVTPMVEPGGDIELATNAVLNELNLLSGKQKAKVQQAMVEMDESFFWFQEYIIITGLFLVIATLIIAVIIIRSLVRPVNKIKTLLADMSKGVLPDHTIEVRSDEIGEMSFALNSLIEGLKATSLFSQEIGKGNFDASFEPLSDEDILGRSLINTRNNLKKAAEEEEKRKKEDAHRTWSAQGLAKFSDLLRLNNDNMEELSYSIISNLVKYLDANQGGLFIVNDEDQADLFVELTACYAFDRRKFMEKRIEIGEGLVGRCIQEGETIYMTDVPKDYINITSGLGSENPSCLIIVPLKLNEQIYGVIEIASFKVFEPYQVEFIEKVGESIASTISSVKINIRTTALLEQTRQQAEEMSAQEEEMRQNIEELQATQEESARREAELQKALENLKSIKS